jgi:hypothetical protein
MRMVPRDVPYSIFATGQQVNALNLLYSGTGYKEPAAHQLSVGVYKIRTKPECEVF